MSIEVEQLNKLFKGKRVNITHSGNRFLKDRSGTCLTFHKTETGVDIELTDESRWGFVPDKLTTDSIEGDVGFATGRRKVELA